LGAARGIDDSHGNDEFLTCPTDVTFDDVAYAERMTDGARVDRSRRCHGCDPVSADFM
jgi:hypothetical protein